MSIFFKAFYRFFNEIIVGNFASPWGIAKDHVIFLFPHIKKKIRLSNMTHDHVSITNVVLKCVIDPCKLNAYIVNIICIYIFAFHSLRELQNKVTCPAARVNYVFCCDVFFGKEIADKAVHNLCGCVICAFFFSVFQAT